jgi:spermidine/putrescine transport system permease protein
LSAGPERGGDRAPALGWVRRRLGAGRAGPIRPGQLSAWFATPAILLGLAFTLGPMIVVAVFSLMAQPTTGTGVEMRFSTKAYEHFFMQESFTGESRFDPRYLRVFAVSAALALGVTVLCVALAFPIAVWMSTRTPRAQNMLLLAVTIPFWTNLLVRTYAWMLILAESGPANSFLAFLGVEPTQMLYTWQAAFVGLVYTFLPFAILPIYSAVAGFDFALAEAAYDLGAGKLAVLRKVIWPAASGGVVSAVALCLVPAFGSYVQPVLLGGGRLVMVGSLIASQFGEARNWPFGAALSVIILVLTLLGALALMRWTKRSAQKVTLAV